MSKRYRTRLGFTRSNKELVRFSRQRNRELILKYKARPCFDCGVQYNPWVMQFDHRDPLQKRYNLTKMGWCSVETLLSEISKCDVVCANCHAERTQRGKHWAVRREVVEKPDFQQELFSPTGGLQSLPTPVNNPHEEKRP